MISMQTVGGTRVNLGARLEWRDVCEEKKKKKISGAILYDLSVLVNIAIFR